MNKEKQPKVTSGWLKRFSFLPILIIIAAVSFGLRFSEFIDGVSSLSNEAQAQSQILDKPMSDPPEVKEEEIEKVELNKDISEALEGASDQKENPDIEWRDADDTEFEYSEVRMELFKDLSKRRKVLEDKERALSVREALLKAAEQEINQKYEELLSIRSEIKDLLAQQSEEEQKRIASLVKIYEGMKPKDAARIFNTLDRDVLIQVVSKMSERKSAPIIASMDPDRARTLTIMLMEQRSLNNRTEDFL